MSEMVIMDAELDEMPPGSIVFDGDSDLMVKGDDLAWHQLAQQDEPSECWTPARVVRRGYSFWQN